MVFRHLVGIIRADLVNLLTHGANGPGYKRRIHVDPRSMKRRVMKIVECDGRHVDISKMSGVVTDECFWGGAEPVENNPAVACSLRHWRDGLSWDESGEIHRMMQAIDNDPRGHIAGCRTLDDVHDRCRRLDDIFRTVKRESKLRECREAGARGWLRIVTANRETDGILVHLGLNGEPIFGSIGAHRLAMCIALDLSSIPATVGLVHRSSIGFFHELRSRPPCDPR